MIMNKSKIFSLFIVTGFLLLVFSNSYAGALAEGFAAVPTTPLTAAGVSPMAGAMQAAQQYYQQMQQIQYEQAMMQQRLYQERLQNHLMAERIAEEQQAQIYAANTRVLSLYSQNKHPIFLGCLTCNHRSKYATTNSKGAFGSSNGKFSIYNAHGIYGSSKSNFSPCNPHALYPPVVVNNNGVKLALLTLNARLFGADNNSEIVRTLRTKVCGKENESKKA